ncbi:uncharacterized protein [Pyrus communis]|uniref:uncharacterized protein n=1 Tax=Pyrus communis TaxID=23211 RepID=UPI0035C0280A
MWLRHENFKEFVAGYWSNGGCSVADKTCALVKPLKKWDIQVFGHLKQRKRRLLARIDGIQKVLRRGPNKFLSKLEDELISEYNEVLNEEAIFWHQKSRLMWLQEGDRNTNFFHLTTIVRRRRNRIEGLINNQGSWISEPSNLKKLAAEYFQTIFSRWKKSKQMESLPNFFPDIHDADCEALTKDI